MRYVGEALPDSSYVATTTFQTYYPRLLKINSASGWMPALSDPTPWIKVDMLNVHTIMGMYLQKFNGYYIKKYLLKSSMDGTTYHYIGQDIVANYLSSEDHTTYWFINATDGTYWTIELINNADNWSVFPFII